MTTTALPAPNPARRPALPAPTTADTWSTDPGTVARVLSALRSGVLSPDYALTAAVSVERSRNRG